MSKKTIITIWALSFVLMAFSVSAWYSSFWNFADNFTDPNGLNYTNRYSNFSKDTLALQNAGKMSDNCSEVRIVNHVNVSLDYKMYGCGLQNTTFWFNYTNDTNVGDLQFYYGYNGSAIPFNNNITHWTFGEDFDTFENATDILVQKPNIWTSIAEVYEADNGTAYSGSSTANMSGVFEDIDNTAGWTAYNWSDPLEYGKFRIKFLTTKGNLDPNPFMIRDVVGNDVVITLLDYGNANHFAYVYAGSGWTTMAYLTLNTWYEVIVDWNYTGFNITLRNDTFLKTDTGRAHRDGSGIGAQRFLWDSGANAEYTVHFDEVIVQNVSGQEYIDPPFVFSGEWNATTPPIPPVPTPTVVDFDYCRLLWLEQNAGVLSNDDWCVNNNTIARNITFQITVDGNVSNIVSYREEICRFGCDNMTNECAPDPFKLNAIILIFIVALILLGGWLVSLLK